MVYQGFPELVWMRESDGCYWVKMSQFGIYTMSLQRDGSGSPFHDIYSTAQVHVPRLCLYKSR